MDSSLNPFSLLSHSLTLIFLCLVPLLIILPSVKTISDINSFVYKECANQTLINSITTSYSQTLSSLFQDLIYHSSNSMFFKATAAGAGAGADQTAISGLFQCRGDISNGECFNCVSALSEMANTKCSENVAAARIQLSGCYIHYETDDGSLFADENSKGPRLIYKSCEESNNIVGFREMINEAFVEVESGVVSGENNGFYEMNYELVHVLAQCEGDLGGCDCGECVSSAVVIAQDECVNSVSGQIYMDNCFLSYTYYPNGIPSDLSPGGKHEEKGGGNNTGKSIAIVAGGAAALGLGFMFWMFMKSLAKKDDDY